MKAVRENKVCHKQLAFQTKGNKISYFEIKQDCLDFIQETGLRNGILIVQSPHTTCSVFFEEIVHDMDALGDEYLQHDLNKHLNQIYPKQLTYDDDYHYPGPLHRASGMESCSSAFRDNPAILLNGDAHCKATLIGSDASLILKDGQLQWGSYGSLYFVDFDGNRARNRHCHLCILGW